MKNIRNGINLVTPPLYVQELNKPNSQTTPRTLLPRPSSYLKNPVQLPPNLNSARTTSMRKPTFFMGIDVIMSDANDNTPHPRVPDPARTRLNEFLRNPRTNIRSIPEYHQRNFFFVVAHRSEAEFLEQMRIAQNILNARSDTKITLLVPRGYEQDFRNEIRSHARWALPFLQNQRIQIIGSNQESLWAQDFGEAVQRDGVNELLRPVPTPSGLISGLDTVLTNPHGRTTNIPIYFQGGDVTQTEVNGVPTVVIGQQSIDMTRCYYLQHNAYPISNDEIRLVIQQAFGVHNVIILANDNPLTANIDARDQLTQHSSQYAFHIDQYALFPSPGVVIMPSANFNVTGSQDRELSVYRENLIRVRDQLQQAGFRIIDIPADINHIRNHQSYTNGIPIQLENGSTRLILPSFVGSEALETNIRGILERNHFEVEFVRNETADVRGNTHCLTGSFGL